MFGNFAKFNIKIEKVKKWDVHGHHCTVTLSDSVNCYSIVFR